MKRVVIIVACAFSLLATSAEASIILTYQSLGLAATFDGAGGFSFAPGPNIVVVDSTNAGDSIGLLGALTGSFTIGTPYSIPGGEAAAVLGTGSFSLTDPDGDLLTGDLTIGSMSLFAGFFAQFNQGLALNLSNLTYDNADLTNTTQDFFDLIEEDSAKLIAQMTFFPGTTIMELEGSQPFTGQVVMNNPEPSAYVTWCLLGVVVGGYCWRRKTQQIQALRELRAPA